jgi:hypothetical protein
LTERASTEYNRQERRGGNNVSEKNNTKAKRTPLKDHEGLFVHDDIKRDADKEIRIVETILTEAQRAQRTREDKPGK